jgi:hypothetical protein
MKEPVMVITLLILIIIGLLIFIFTKINQSDSYKEFFYKLENLVTADNVYNFRQQLKYPVSGMVFSLKNYEIKAVNFLVADSSINDEAQFIRVYVEKVDGSRVYDRNFANKKDICKILNIIEKGRFNLLKRVKQ